MTIVEALTTDTVVEALTTPIYVEGSTTSVYVEGIAGRVVVVNSAATIGTGGTDLWGLTSRERISLVSDSVTIAAVGAGGSWKESQVREPDGVRWDPATGQYVCAYSGRGADGLLTQVALSFLDGGTWDDTAAPIAANMEDPCIVCDARTQGVWRDDNGRAYIYGENKNGATQLGIRLIVTEPDSWVIDDDLGQVIDPGDFGLSEVDVDSPTIKHLDGLFIGLFEVRPAGHVYMCRATANPSTPETWTCDQTPLLGLGDSGSWNDADLVPDDWTLQGTETTLFVHGSPGSGYAVGRYRTSVAPGAWDADSFVEMVGNPFSDATDTVMLYGDDLTLATWVGESGIEQASVVFPSTAIGSGVTLPIVKSDVTGLVSDLAGIDGRLDGHDDADTALAGRVTALEGATPAEVTTDDVATGDPSAPTQTDKNDGFSGFAASVGALLTGGTSGQVLGQGPAWVDPTGGSGTFSTLVGDGSATTFTVTHGLGTTSIGVPAVIDVATGEIILPLDPTVVDDDTVELTFSVAPTTNQYRVVILAAGGTSGTDTTTPLLLASFSILDEAETATGVLGVTVPFDHTLTHLCVHAATAPAGSDLTGTLNASGVAASVDGDVLLADGDTDQTLTVTDDGDAGAFYTIDIDDPGDTPAVDVSLSLWGVPR